MVIWGRNYYREVKNGGVVIALKAEELGNKGAIQIAKALTDPETTVEVLELDENRIGDEGAKALAQALKTNTTLRVINLSDNEIRDEGAKALAEALKTNGMLEIMILNGNCIGDDGAKALAEELKNMSALRVLSLEKCGIGDKGAKSLAEALIGHSTLNALELLYNYEIRTGGARALADALKSNWILEDLTLSLKSDDLLSEIESLLCCENRDKRRVELEKIQDKLAYSTCKANEWTPPGNKPNDPLSAVTSSPPAVTPPQPPRKPAAVPSPSPSIMTDRTKVRELLGNFEAEPAALSAEYFSLLLQGKVSLGTGSFGLASFSVLDDVLKKKFDVKMIPMGLGAHHLDFVMRPFRQEIQMLQRFRHPNIVRMYGYYLSPNESSGTHYLLYEFAALGSLESMLKTEDGRKILTFPKRLRILHGVAQGLNFLHTGIQWDPNLPSMETYTAFHRDINSANIGITSTFGAKLIDCGFEKLVAKDSHVVESISRSATVKTSGGGNLLGTPAYRDPGYEHRDYEYGSYCDIFSFGVVMAEVFTGTLSGIATGTVGSSASDGRTMYRKYVHIGRKQRTLRMDVDDLISDASEESLNELSSMSLQCMDDDIDNRPKASGLVAMLQDMIMRNHCGETWRRPDPPSIPGGAGAATGERCCMCHKLTTIGLSCLDHFICSEHLLTHSGIASGQDPLECMMDGCTKCYLGHDVKKFLPTSMYNQYISRQRMNADYRILINQLVKKVDDLSSKFDVVHDTLRYLKKNSDRALVALAHLATGEETPCPKLVLIVPQKRIERSGAKGMKDLFKDAFFQETAVYFLCENTFAKGHDEPIRMNFGRKWVKHLLPLVKLSLITLRMTGALMTGLPFPIPDVIPSSEPFQYLEDFVTEFLMEDSKQSMQDTLQDMETWVSDIVEKREPMMEGSRLARMKEVVGSSYTMLSEKALKEENLPKWRHSMTTQLGHDDNGKVCKIKWIKV